MQLRSITINGTCIKAGGDWTANTFPTALNLINSRSGQIRHYNPAWFYTMLWCVFIMPTKEYRILIDGKIVNREYTSRKHEIMVKVFEEHGKPFTTEIVDLV